MIDIPEAFEFLFHPMRYKIARGGRGSGKSRSFSAALILKATQKKIRVLCTREIQNSIKESVHKLLSDQIERITFKNGEPATKFFHVTNNSITCENGSEFIFAGLLRNVDQIKSMEDIDICWVSEAHNVTEESWDILLPTIRAENSEIWVDFNPKFDQDPTYVRWVTNAPENCVSKLINYDQNPFFPAVLEIEMQHDKDTNLTLYKQKWMGEPLGMGGRVWPQFEQSVHVKEFQAEELMKEANFYQSMDPHAHYYPACGWLAVFPINARANWPEDYHFHVYNEYPKVEDLGGFYHEKRKKLTFNGTLEDLSKHIYAGDGSEHGYKIKKRGIDTRFAKGSGGWNWATGSTLGIVELWAKQENGGLLFTMPPEKMIDSQRQFIHKLMFYNKNAPISSYNQPRFSVDPKCQNLIASLTNHRLEEESEKESEKFKDFSDMLRIMFAIIEEWKPAQTAPAPAPSGSGSWMG